MAGASTAGYVYLYSFYYFFFKTKMYGLFQNVFYFGNMALFSAALGIMCGKSSSDLKKQCREAFSLAIAYIICRTMASSDSTAQN